MKILEATINIRISNSVVIKTINELWLPIPTQLFIHGQWWSNLSTHMLHIAQCLLLDVRITLQSGHISHGCTFLRSSIKECSGFNLPGSLILALIKEIAGIIDKNPIEYAKNSNF